MWVTFTICWSSSDNGCDWSSFSSAILAAAAADVDATDTGLCLISLSPTKHQQRQHNWKKFHLVELNGLILISSEKPKKIIYFWRFDLYQRPSSEEAGTRSSSSGSWRDKLESSQESGRTYDWVGSSLCPGSWIVVLPSGYELPPWPIW